MQDRTIVTIKQKKKSHTTYRTCRVISSDWMTLTRVSRSIRILFKPEHFILSKCR